MFLRKTQRAVDAASLTGREISRRLHSRHHVVKLTDTSGVCVAMRSNNSIKTNEQNNRPIFMVVRLERMKPLSQSTFNWQKKKYGYFLHKLNYNVILRFRTNSSPLIGCFDQATYGSSLQFWLKWQIFLNSGDVC